MVCGSVRSGWPPIANVATDCALSRGLLDHGFFFGGGGFFLESRIFEGLKDYADFLGITDFKWIKKLRGFF
jgi:hypothetical protein